MTITVKTIADSVNKETGARITTLECRYPRFIHAEVMTHRVFSRNASSSRAIPVERLIGDIMRDTAMPMHWGKNQPGMQAREEHNALVGGEGVSGYDHFDNAYDGVSREKAWLKGRDHAINVARAFHKAGYHKQIVNRILEPYSHINVLITSTEWDNFLALRDHPDAQPEMQVLAKEIRRKLDTGTPVELEEGEWHLPYLAEEDYAAIYADSRGAPNPDQAATSIAILVSVARCARVSYKTHDDRRPGLSEDLLLAEKLMEANPPHLSPTEHQAFADRWRDPRKLSEKDYLRDHLHGNLTGFVQFRKLFEQGKNQ